MACDFEELDVCLCVTTPIGSMYQSELIAWNCAIIIQGRLFRGYLILLGICGYDIILGMDWLTKYCTTIDCNRTTVTLVTPDRESIQYKGGDSRPSVPMIFATKAYKLIGKGCTVYLCAVEASDNKNQTLKISLWYKNFQKFSRKYQDCLLTVRLSLL